MSDQIDVLFERLRGQRPPAPFLTPTQVRALGRRRRNWRTLAIAGGAMAATAAVGGGLVASPAWNPPGPPDTAPTTIAPTTPVPAPTDIPEGYLLQVSDLGPGAWGPLREMELFDNGIPWRFGGLCEAQTAADYPAVAHYLSLKTVGYVDENTRYPDLHTVIEDVQRYEPGWGTRSLEDVRRAVTLCGTATPPPGVAPNRLYLEGNGFAGDESILVRQESYFFQGETIDPEPLVIYLGVVRVGDVVATVSSTSGGAAYVRTLAEHAAARIR